jgi:hypothetical protein
MDEDMGFDRFLEEQYEDRFWFYDDSEQFELNQLALDNDSDDLYDEDEYYDSGDYDDDL